MRARTDRCKPATCWSSSSASSSPGTTPPIRSDRRSHLLLYGHVSLSRRQRRPHAGQRRYERALGPNQNAWLAGTTTIPWIVAEPELSFSQMALNMQPEHVQAFLHGRRLFHTDFATGIHSDEDNPVFTAQAGKLGPLSSATRCVSCHVGEGRGALPAVGAALESMAVKLYAPHDLGNQLQAQEGQALLERYSRRKRSRSRTARHHAPKAGVRISRPRERHRRRARLRLRSAWRARTRAWACSKRFRNRISCARRCRRLRSGGISGRPQLVEDPAHPV